MRAPLRLTLAVAAGTVLLITGVAQYASAAPENARSLSTTLAVDDRATSSSLVANFTYTLTGADCPANGPFTGTVALRGTASGGTPPYSFDWRLPTGIASGANVSTTLTYRANNTVTLIAHDSAGNSATRSDNLTFTPPPCPVQVQGFGPSPSSVWSNLLLIAPVLVLLGLGLVWLWRHPRRPAPAGPN